MRENTATNSATPAGYFLRDFSLLASARMEEASTSGRKTKNDDLDATTMRTPSTRKEDDDGAVGNSNNGNNGNNNNNNNNNAADSLKDAADYLFKKPKEQIEEEEKRKKKKEKEKPKVYKPIQIPTAEEQMQGDVMNNCAVKTVLSGVMGGFLGIAMGIFFGAFEAPDHTMTQKKVSIAETLKQTARNTASKSWSYAKGFAAFGALYAGSECVVEQTRARHDIYNSAYAGCFTGGTMAARAGPKAACIGCGTMAALSVAMDHFMGLH
jgi:import inner membrane translocase subunit TIM22